MAFDKWLRSNVEFGRTLVGSGWEGAERKGREFLAGDRLDTYLTPAAREAICGATTGVCIGAIGSYLLRKEKRTNSALVFGILGGAIGFGAGLAWRARHLLASGASGALENINARCEERWLKNNPIDYA